MIFSDQRVPTGIDGLDIMLRGGFPLNSIVLICGGSGAGKTIFSLQYIVSALRRGESCVYVCFEEPVAKKYGYADSFGWDFDVADKNGLLIPLEFKIIHNNKFSLNQNVGNPNYNIEQSIIEAVQKTKAKHVVIDSLTSILVQESKSDGIRQAVNQLYEAVRLLRCNAVITSEGVPNKGVFYMEQFLSDGVIIMSREVREFHLIKTILVDKMRGIAFDDQPRRYSISEKGIQVFNSEPVLM